MDGSRFDRLTKSLSTPGSRRRALGGLLAGGLGLLGVGDEDAAAHDLKATCKKKSGDAKKKCKKKAKKHKAQHAIDCATESSATTCAGRCGTWANTCGQAVTCPSCPKGQVCLSNGTCVRPCTDGGCGNCTPNSSCHLPNTDGLRLCGIDGQQCVDLQRCPGGTTDCPAGFSCNANCGGSARCARVANCPACGEAGTDCSANADCCEGICCGGVCAAADCAGRCFEQCTVGQPCCTGMTCREEAPGSPVFSCQP